MWTGPKSDYIAIKSRQLVYAGDCFDKGLFYSSILLSLTTDLFSLYVLFSQYRSCDNTLGNCFFQISFYSLAYVRIIYEKTNGQVPLGPLLGKQNKQAKEVYKRTF